MMNAEVGFGRKVLRYLKNRHFLRAYAFRNRYHDRICPSVEFEEYEQSVIAGFTAQSSLITWN